MKNNTLRIIQRKLEEIQSEFKNMDSTSSSVEGFISLNELYETVDLYCKTNGLNMKDIALLAGISSTTLTKALRTPENTTMNTILAIGEVVGFRVLLGRGNV